MSRSREHSEHEAGGVIAWGPLSSLEHATGWVNSPALSAASLSGKVALVQFGTFTCVNWLRTVPYMRAWADKYRDAGLIVIGAQTPEFSFEHDLDNIRAALRGFRVRYPVAVDNDYGIWRGFDNQYWPALYLLDGSGAPRYHHFGEGAYDESERMIQQLLAESGARPVHDLVSVAPQGIEVPADWDDVKSPETYVGYDKADAFASPGGAVPDRAHAYVAPRNLSLNQWALDGDWTIGKEFITSNAPAARLLMRFHSRDLNLVMGTPRDATPVRFRVTLDGQPPGAGHGTDINADGSGTAGAQRTYQLIRQRSPSADGVCQIEFLDPGVEVFVFTFG